MCGIAGAISANHGLVYSWKAVLESMARSLVHRGPDDQGIWFDEQQGIGLAHRRLSIVDLSASGHQPMRSRNSRYVIAFNGEIYNYRDIRTDLSRQGHDFVSTSDTEVLLAAVVQWGFRGTLDRIEGMFAIALWDSEKGILTLARDRFGEKPLYYGRFNGTLIFGSELRALREHPVWDVSIDRDALALLMRFDFIPAPYSIFRQVRKLRPGALLEIQRNGNSLDVRESLYWDYKREALQATAQPFSGTPEEAVDAVSLALHQSIRRQMVADVPVGAFLSGGIDSSLVVSAMQRISDRPVHTYSIGFTEKEYDESGHAARMASLIGTRHTQMMVSPEEVLAVIPSLPRIYDEPFADSSQIPTCMVSVLARKEVTVSLSGDAGDELFGGYWRYQDLTRRMGRSRSISGWFRRAAGIGLDSLFRRGAGTLPGKSAGFGVQHGGWIPDYLSERSVRWRAKSLFELYRSMMSMVQRPADLVIGAREPLTELDAMAEQAGSFGDRRFLMLLDTGFYLPDDVLVKVDRAAMAVSLETRVPLLDSELARLAWRIPDAIHFADGRGKWILRQLLARHVPVDSFDRPKQGFAVPVARWLRTDLKSWAQDLLSVDRLRRQGFLEPSLVARRWQQHLEGRMNWAANLWGILMFQAWCDEWGL